MVAEADAVFWQRRVRAINATVVHLVVAVLLSVAVNVKVSHFYSPANLMYISGAMFYVAPVVASFALVSNRKQVWRLYFFPRFCGARCDSADAATLRTGLLLLGDLSTFAATFATFALVLRLPAIPYTSPF